MGGSAGGMGSGGQMGGMHQQFPCTESASASENERSGRRCSMRSSRLTTAHVGWFGFQSGRVRGKGMAVVVAEPPRREGRRRRRG